MDTQVRNLRLGDAVYPGKGKEKKHVISLRSGKQHIEIKYDDGSEDFVTPGTTRHVLDYERKLPQ